LYIAFTSIWISSYKVKEIDCLQPSYKVNVFISVVIIIF
jgi:hypothetical protein